MSLSDAYKSLEKAKARFPQCKTCQWYAGLDPDDKAFFDNKVADPDMIGHRLQRTLLRACREAGLDCAHSSFGHHLSEHHALIKDEVQS